MKSIFVTYNQAYYHEIIDLFEKKGFRGYTRWTDICGRGSVNGEPHEGSHAWPTNNDAVMSVVDDSSVDGILAALKEMDSATPELGLRAFVFNVEQAI